MNLRKLGLITVLFSGTYLYSQNVAINTTGAVANASAMLDVSSTNTGILVPRIALTNTIAAAPVTTPATSLLVYNTATVADITPGYYYWNGTAWVRMLNTGNAWQTTGNTGTNPAIHFAGTIDAVDFVIRTSNTEKMRITAGGNAGIGTNAPAYQLTLGGTGNVFGVENTSSFAAKNSGGGYETYLWPRWSDNIMYLNYGTGGFHIRTNGSASTMFMTNAGNVGITTTTPAYRLDLNSGTFGFGNGNVRTESRDNAGLQGNAGAQSGFFETPSPTNYPAGASSWWHLIDTRHSNNGNNYALQISGSFFDQNLYFRKTNNNPAQPWSQILTTANIACGTTNYVPKMTSASTMGCSQIYDNGTNVGIGTAGPGYKLDIAGLGAWNVDLRTTGRIWTNSADGGMWLSDLQDCFMGNISAAQCGFYTSSVGWSAFNITKSNGYIGMGTTGPTSRLHVYADADNAPVIYGQNVNATGGTTSYGVRGECGSSGLGSAGVSGVSTNSGQNEIGVVGDYSLWGASIFGLAWASAYTDMPTTRDFGVFATCNFSTGTGVYARDMSGAAGSYAFYGTGKFAVTGTKSASVPTSKGNQLVYCTESPEIWFEDLGGGQLNNGQTHISLDELFLETVFIDNEHPMHVFLQEQGESNGLIVIPDADHKGFTVKEKSSGISNISFSYRIMAKRRFYQDHRFGVDSNQPFENNIDKAQYVNPVTTDPIEMKNWVDEQTRLKEQQMKEQKGNK